MEVLKCLLSERNLQIQANQMLIMRANCFINFLISMRRNRWNCCISFEGNTWPHEVFAWGIRTKPLLHTCYPLYELQYLRTLQLGLDKGLPSSEGHYPMHLRGDCTTQQIWWFRWSTSRFVKYFSNIL
ncbi:uncharacterized protein LOC131859641 isoform X2 [Cryptomeria japonica]|uniref:uncharacterized protein LOC131859641 isoform X2 n=1 Tax=Cryptomeria japonica TaxID=3369 RepID=UPI0027DA8DF6|nr:uncharacterized protein LOC131859641 isoform X2 [Cryptomeria japonica]